MEYASEVIPSTDAAKHATTTGNRNTMGEEGLETVKKPTKQGVETISLISKTILL